jgi:sensor domain CHASE-containing protein
MQKVLISVICLLAASLLILVFNHQFIESLLVYSQDSNNNHNKLQSITYYNIFSDLSRNFTGTVDKFKHSNDNINPPQDSGNARH